MNGTESARLAAAINLLRPDWPTASLQTFIAKNLTARPYRDAAVALTWVATEQRSDGSNVSGTPARVLTAGPWWQTTSSERTGEGVKATRCDLCREIHTPGAPHVGTSSQRVDSHIGELRKAAGLCPDCRRDRKCEEHTKQAEEVDV